MASLSSIGMHGIEWSPLLVAAWAGHAKVPCSYPRASAFPFLSLLGKLLTLFFSVCVFLLNSRLVCEAVEFLLASGADRSATSAREHLGVPAGSTPLAAALLKGHTHVAALLQ